MTLGPTSPALLRKVSINGIDNVGCLPALAPCIATRLLNLGTEFSYSQEFLGHQDTKTTFIYTHLTNQALVTIKSPLDQLRLDYNFIEKT